VSRRRAAARAARLITPLLFISASAWPAAAPTAADLARCAAMTAPDARLACYDSLSAPAASAATPAPAAPAAPTASAPALPPPAPTAPPAATPAPPVPAPAPATSAPASSAVPADDPQNFGFTQAQVQAHTQAPPPPGLQSIQAHIANVLTDRQGNGYVLLDNGQMWTYQGDDGRMRPGEPVTIKRASLGSYIMVTQSRRSYHVTRQR